MVIQTSRFGPVQLEKEDIVDFPEGILGFNDLRRFVLLDDPNDEIFAWLQSCDVPGIAFPILEPEVFTEKYNPTLTKHDMEALSLEKGEKTRAFSIITIPEDPTQMTANLKAPILINVRKRVGRQCVLQDNSLAIKEMIFAKLQQRVVQNPQKSIKGEVENWGVGVRLPAPGRAPEVQN